MSVIQQNLEKVTVVAGVATAAVTSTATSSAVINKFGSLFQLLKALEEDKHCLDRLLYKTKKGQERRISKTSVANIVQYLLQNCVF